ncbi:uncharacterized protein KZ484_000936 isoform 2-T2 [Pholidichthys leucotaenia]
MTSVSTLKSHRLDVLQQNDSNQEEVLDEQQLLNQERNIIVVQVGADCSQIKEEQEDVCISREGEQFGLKQETHAFDEDVLQQNDSNQEEVLDEQQLLNQERNIIVVQMGADCSQIKEEQEDVCISREGEQFGLKQETHAFDEGRRKSASPQRTLRLWKVLESFAFIGKREIVHHNWTLPHYLQRCRLKIC